MKNPRRGYRASDLFILPGGSAGGQGDTEGLGVCSPRSARIRVALNSPFRFGTEIPEHRRGTVRTGCWYPGPGDGGSLADAIRPGHQRHPPRHGRVERGSGRNAPRTLRAAAGGWTGSWAITSARGRPVWAEAPGIDYRESSNGSDLNCPESDAAETSSRGRVEVCKFCGGTPLRSDTIWAARILRWQELHIHVVEPGHPKLN